jgi:hypothetical protein
MIEGNETNPRGCRKIRDQNRERTNMMKSNENKSESNE